MGQGLTGAPGMYTRLKDLCMGPIPEPNSEPALDNGLVAFDHFMDDDSRAAESVDELLQFFHKRYFPHLAWAGLTLNPRKSVFFTSKVTLLRHECTIDGIRPSASKISALRNWPTPTNKTELMRFVNGLPFLRIYIPGRANLTKTLKEAIIYEGKGKAKWVSEFVWTACQQQTFNKLQTYISQIKLSGGDLKLQYHLSTDASNSGVRGVLFQMEGAPVGTRSSRTTYKRERAVMFMSFTLADPETCYHTTEKETLAVLKCLEEVRWLVKGSTHLMIVYTDHRAVKSVLGVDLSSSSDRVMRWQYWLQEYNIDVVHIPGAVQVIADGLSRILHWRATTQTEVSLLFFSLQTSVNKQEKNQADEDDNQSVHKMKDMELELKEFQEEQGYVEGICQLKEGRGRLRLWR